MEDRFSDTVPNGQANMAYLRDNYFNDSAYFRYGPNTDPLVGIFGPITFEDTLDWDSIMPYAGEDIEFLTLWYQKGDAGQHADGEYAWIYEVDSLNDHLTRQENFYKNRAPNLKTAMALAYPGFDDFYAQGGAGSSLFTIPHDSGATLDSVLLRVGQNDSVIDLLQLATWNDFGEGTMFEPTCEFGYEFLTRLQDFLGVPYGEYELTQIKRLYDLRQDYENDSLTQLALDRVFDHFVALEDSDAVWLMDSIEGLLVSLESNSMRDIKVFPNPASDILYIEGEFSPAARFYFVDLVGRRMELAINENRLNLQGVNPGVYVLRIEDGLKTLSIRVIIE